MNIDQTKYINHHFDDTATIWSAHIIDKAPLYALYKEKLETGGIEISLPKIANYYLEGHHVLCFILCQKLVDMAPNNQEARIFLSQLYELAGNQKKAQEYRAESQ